MTLPAQPSPHPDFATLADSWDLTLDSDQYAHNTRRSYGRALVGFAGWLAEHHPDAGPVDVTRDQVRAWIVHIRNVTSSGTARSHFAGIRHFFKWALVEGEVTVDPTDGIRTPPPNDPRTPLLSIEDIRALLATCAGRDFVAVRDRAIILLFVDAGLRMAEVSGLTVESVDIRERAVHVEGKGSNRSGPRRRTVYPGTKTVQALDRYLRERRKHPYADLSTLWLGGRNRPTISADGVDAMLQRRANRVGLKLHSHQFRHTWADAFRAAGGSEGDLMTMGGWRSRAMLDRYGRTNAEGRARDAYRKLSLGDRI